MKNSPQVFLLDSGVWHRPSKRKNIDGSFVRKNKAKKGWESIEKYACWFGKAATRGGIYFG